MVQTVNHPHGNHGVTHGEGKVHVKDPGGFTSSMSHGGTIPGGTSRDDGPSSKINKGTV